MRFESFECEVRVLFRGKRINMDKIIAEIDVDAIAPIDGPVDPFDFNLYQNRRERRQRFIDMIAAEFAHALTEALYNKGT